MEPPIIGSNEAFARERSATVTFSAAFAIRIAKFFSKANPTHSSTVMMPLAPGKGGPASAFPPTIFAPVITDPEACFSAATRVSSVKAQPPRNNGRREKTMINEDFSNFMDFQECIVAIIVIISTL